VDCITPHHKVAQVENRKDHSSSTMR